MKKILIAIILLVGIPSLKAQVAIGHWRDHLSFSTVNHVAVAGNTVYAASGNGLFTYSLQDYSVSTLSKSEGLSDAGVETMAYDPDSKMLVVAYSNSNIDLLEGDKVYNISDIKRSEIPGSKTIHHIRFHNHKAYLATGFGIVVLDLKRHEIQEVYYLGAEGTQVSVNDILFSGDKVLASVGESLLSAPSNSPLLGISSTWESLHLGFEVQEMETIGNDILLLSRQEAENQVYQFSLSHSLPMPWVNGNIRHLKKSGNNLLLIRNDRVTIYDSQLQPLGSVGDGSWVKMSPNDAELTSKGALFVAHDWSGMLYFENWKVYEVESIYPTGPFSDNAYQLRGVGDKIFLCPGGKTTTYANAYLPGNVSVYQNNTWTTLSLGAAKDTLVDFLDVAVNPKDNHQLLAASWMNGLVEIRDNKVVEVYNEANSEGAIQAYRSNSFRNCRVGSVCFDRKGNAWFTNSLQSHGLVERKKDGGFQSFDVGSMVQGQEIDKIIWDSLNGYLWFAGRANKLFVHDGEGKMAYVNPNNGSKLETTSITCFVQDHDNEIWIGTNKGIKVIYNTSSAFRNGGNGEMSPITCSNPIMSEEFDEYLMAYESITAMVVDGADRKWVGTSNGGLYLLSSNGLQQIEHYTAENSPLYSNKIITLAIQPQSGEVFVGTDKGVQSLRYTATEANNYIDKSQIHVFPNPVKPDYDGPIAIKGFTRNAPVHICDAAGHVVFTTTAQGGQAIWYGTTNEGVKVASGTYFVFAADLNGQNRAVAKVLIVR